MSFLEALGMVDCTGRGAALPLKPGGVPRFQRRRISFRKGSRPEMSNASERNAIRIRVNHPAVIGQMYRADT